MEFANRGIDVFISTQLPCKFFFVLPIGNGNGLVSCFLGELNAKMSKSTDSLNCNKITSNRPAVVVIFNRELA